MTFILINQACDGRHVQTFKTGRAALQAMADWFGQPVENFQEGRSYSSDWGNRLTVEERADGHTAALERKLANAFDARECGTARKSQLALLAKHNF